MRKIRQVLRQHFETQKSNRAIALSLGISREAVSDYLTRAAVAGLSWPLQPTVDDADLERLLFPPIPVSQNIPKPDWSSIHTERKKPNATLGVLHEEYLKEHPQGIRYSQFCTLYREYVFSLKPYLRQVYTAGERVLVDYAGAVMRVHDAQSNTIRSAQLFIGVLGASCYIYAEAHWSQKTPNWLSAHARMFQFFGGVPEIVVCDNLKSGVTKASRTEPVINESYQHLADHFGCEIVPARARKPTDKAKVENTVLYIQRQIVFVLRKRTFTSLGELNEAIQQLVHVLNAKPFQKLPGSRSSNFEAVERPAMRPLPVAPYEYTEFKRVNVGLDYRVKVDQCLYSVPYQLCRKAVDVRITESTIEILHGGRRIASHERYDGVGDRVRPEHMPPNHRYFKEWNINDALDWAQIIGSNTHHFLTLIFENTRVREQGYRAHNTFKKLERDMGADRLEAACNRAIAIGATSLSSIRSILRNQLDRVPVQPEEAKEADFEHTNIRGSDYYH